MWGLCRLMAQVKRRLWLKFITERRFLFELLKVNGIKLDWGERYWKRCVKELETNGDRPVVWQCWWIQGTRLQCVQENFGLFAAFYVYFRNTFEERVSVNDSTTNYFIAHAGQSIPVQMFANQLARHYRVDVWNPVKIRVDNGTHISWIY